MTFTLIMTSVLLCCLWLSLITLPRNIINLGGTEITHATLFTITLAITTLATINSFHYVQDRHHRTNPYSVGMRSATHSLPIDCNPYTTDGDRLQFFKGWTDSMLDDKYGIKDRSKNEVLLK